jgi:uncharacterized protein (TIGR03382 family)
MNTWGHVLRKALVQAAMAGLVAGLAMGVLLAIRTPLCPADAEDCLIDDYSSISLEVGAGGVVAVVALPIAVLLGARRRSRNEPRS